MPKKLGIRVWILIIALLLSILAISPWKAFDSGVEIASVEKNSTAFEQGLRKGMTIEKINDKKVETVEDYSEIINSLSFSKNFTKIIFQTQDLEIILFAENKPELTVKPIPNTNIETGLDLSGGARALVSPKNVSLSSSQISDLISVTEERFNVYGLTDVNIRPVTDLEGNNFMLVEIAGATPEDLESLVAEQGKFEARIGNKTVFQGGKDISSVCRNDATCSMIRSCQQIQEGYVCQFEFAIYLSEQAAERHAKLTENLSVNLTGQGGYLDKKLDLYLDDSLVGSLLISEDLKGRVTTQIAVSGSGTGKTQQQAYEQAEKNMNKLQTVLITGSLPFKLEIVKLDTISPLLGQKFVNYLLLAALASLLAVAVIILVRYRTFKSSLALLFTSTSEVIIILGVAALINWNLDLASIAGILTVIGTGVDQQIILIDESRAGKLGLIEKLKRAFAIIIGAYFTSLAALIPIYWAGAGLLRGFAVTTIIGITAGVLITRPAFADLLKKIEK